MLHERIKHSLGFHPPLAATRRVLGLSQAELATVLGAHPDQVRREEKRGYGRLAKWAWIIVVAYHIPDPINGLRKAALGLMPNGDTPQEFMDRVKSEGLGAPGTTWVAGYRRRSTRKAGQPGQESTPTG